MAKLADHKLEAMGGRRIHTLGLGDDDANLEDDFITWKEAFWASVCQELNIEASNEEVNTRQYEHKVRPPFQFFFFFNCHGL
jgi:NADPH-ferrihemoprotein reductase